jgi:hypothetical protein
MNIWLIALITILLFTVAVCIPVALSASKPPIVRIGIVKDGPPGRLRDITPLVKEEILKLTSREFDVRFPESKAIEGNWQKNEIERSVDKLLADPEVDLVITLGYLPTNYVCHKEKLPKPVVAPIVGDEADVVFPTLNKRRVRGVITESGTAAETSYPDSSPSNPKTALPTGTSTNGSISLTEIVPLNGALNLVLRRSRRASPS